MFFVQRGDIILGFVLFVLANIGFESGLVFYDAFLPNLTEKKNFGRVSGYGFAMGYVGALTVLLIVMFMLPENSSPDYYYFVRLSFVVAAAFFITFSIPLFLFISEPKTSDVFKKDLIVKGINKSFETLKNIFFKKKYPSVSRFLFAFFLYNDAIITIIAFASIFAANALNMSDNQVIIFFVIVQSTAIAGSFIFGIISDHIGPKKTISITLILCYWFTCRIINWFIAIVQSQLNGSSHTQRKRGRIFWLLRRTVWKIFCSAWSTCIWICI
jgi:UMF1 family MFS transporter